ncbi:MAG: hypothetical protein LBB45_06075 [Methanobrevibacter sp.]|nr:hypothetical protein [Candidatus Methanovirga basalitermitum]
MNDDVLNLSVNVIDMLGFQSTLNATYNDKMIIYYLLNVATSRTIVNNVSNIVIMHLQKEPLDMNLEILI